MNIAFSGLEAGYKIKLASTPDKVFEDNLTDIRVLFYNEYNCLGREGYGFQLINDNGIIFNKFILLLDKKDQREGFLRISIFLNKGEFLDAKDIKDSLDSLWTTFKTKSNRPIIDFAINWDFLTNEFNNLSLKVKKASWRRIPHNVDSTKKILIEDAESRITDFFQYPNFMDKSFATYGHIFLTKQILKPADIGKYDTMPISKTAIDNPSYDINYTDNNNPAVDISSLPKTITKKDLEKTGDFVLGTVSSSGYRDANVTLKEGEKTSKDGCVIDVTIPKLVQKKATITLNIQNVDAKSCTIDWTLQDSSIAPKNGHVRTFIGDECDREWHYSIKKEGYEEKEGVVDVKDGHDETINITLLEIPIWTIIIKKFDNDTPECPIEYTSEPQKVVEKEKDAKVSNLKNELKKKYDDVNDEQDIKNKTITITAKKQKKISNSNSSQDITPHSNTNTNQSNRDKDNNKLVVQGEKTFFIRLDDKSKKYSTFKSYKLKAELDTVIEKLKGKNTKKKNKTAIEQYIETFISCLENKNYKKAIDIYDKYYSTLTNDPNIREAVEICKKIKKINFNKEIVKEPQGVKYDSKLHALTYTGNDYPPDEVKLNKHKWWKYSIPKYQWSESNNGKKYTVVRKFTKKSKELIWTVAAIILILSSIFVYNKCSEKTPVIANTTPKTDKLKTSPSDTTTQETQGSIEVAEPANFPSSDNTIQETNNTPPPQSVTPQSNPEDEAYLKAMAPSGSVADCKNFLGTYRYDANKPSRNAHRQEVGTKLVAFAQNTALDTTSRITACNTYLLHFNKGSNKQAITNIRNGLTNRSTPSTEEKKTTNVEAETKTVIDSDDKLFAIAQDYKAVSMGWPKFQKKYEIKGSSAQESKDLENMANKLCDAIQGINKGDYGNAYKNANNNSNTPAKSKLENLIRKLNEVKNK